jgi:hypothetical protein
MGPCAELKATELARNAWRITKARLVETCHQIVFGRVKSLSFTGFAADCADGVARTVFPALHSYVSDTPEAHRLACCMGWPAACYCCDMPRESAGRTLEDITQPGKWSFRTVAAHDALQVEADRVAAEAVAANRVAVARWEAGSRTRPSPADAAAGLRAQHCSRLLTLSARIDAAVTPDAGRNTRDPARSW